MAAGAHAAMKISTTLDRARDYVLKGYAPIPVPHREKIPIIGEWQNLRIQEADLPRYFNGQPSNIGVLLGAPSKDLVDVEPLLALVGTLSTRSESLPPEMQREMEQMRERVAFLRLLPSLAQTHFGIRTSPSTMASWSIPIPRSAPSFGDASSGLVMRHSTWSLSDRLPRCACPRRSFVVPPKRAELYAEVRQ